MKRMRGMETESIKKKTSLIFGFTIVSELTFSIGQIRFGLLTVYLL